MLVPVFDALYDQQIGEVRLTDVQVQRSVSISEVDRLTAHPVHPGDEAWQQLSLRRVIEVAGEAWRIEDVRFQYSGSGRPRITAAPLWADLADITYTRAGRLRYTALGVSVDEAVDRALDGTGYIRGSLTADDREVFITEQNASVLTILRRIAEAVDEELVIDGQDVRIQQHRSTTATLPIAVDGAVRRELQRQASATTFFTAVSALGGSDDTVTLGDARWLVDLDPATNTITLPEGPIWTDGALVGEAKVGLVRHDGVVSPVAILSTTAPGTIQTAGFGLTDADVSHAVFLDTKDDPDGLTTIVDPEAAAAHGKVVRRVTEESLTPFDNLLQNGDLSTWEAGDLSAWATSSAATVTRSTDVADYGTASARVETTFAGQWIAQTVDYAPDERFPYLSFWIAVRVETGQVRLEVIDSAGTRLPRAERAISTVDEIRGLSVEGEKPAPGPLTLRVVAEEEGTIFYLDAATLTTSATHYVLGEMGPKALWKRAVRTLRQEGGLQPEAFTATIWDTGQDIQLGDTVEVTDKDGADSSFTFTSRVVEITEHIAQDGTLEKELRLSQERADVTDLPLTPPSIPPQEPLEPAPEPRVSARYYVEGTTGKAEITLDDPDEKLEVFEYIAAAGDALSDATWQEAALPYTIEVSLLEKHNATVQWRAVFQDKTESGSHTFDVLERPSADYSVSFFGTDPMTASLIWRGDEDTHDIRWRRGDGLWQVAPGRSGSVSVGTVVKGESLRLRAEARSESGATEERLYDQTIQVPLRLEDVATEAVTSLNLLSGDVFLDGDAPLSITTDGQQLTVVLAVGDTLDVQGGVLEARGVTGETRLGFALDDMTPGSSAGVTPPQDLRPTASPVFTSITSAGYVPKVQGWRVGDDADFRSVTAGELRVQAFIAEVAEAFAGEQLLTESVGTLAEPAAISATPTLVVDALPGFSGMAQFSVGDILRMRVVERGEGVLGQQADRQGYEQQVRLELASSPIPTSQIEAHLVFTDGTTQALPVLQDGGRVVETPVVTDPAIVVVVAKDGDIWHATPVHRIDPVADLGYGVWTVALAPITLESADDPVLTTTGAVEALSGQIQGLDVSDIWVEVDDLTVLGDGTIRYETSLKRGAEGKTAPVGSVVLSYGQGGGFLMERSVIGQGAPYDRQLRWNAGADGLPESYDVITYTGNLAALPQAYASGPGFYSENVRATGSVLVGDLSEAGDFLKYESGVLQISGTVQVGDGDLDTVLAGLVREADLGGLAYKELVEQARLGTTVIQGGFIRTELLDVDTIAAQIIDTQELFTQDFTIKGGGAITAEDLTFRVSAADGFVLNSAAVSGRLNSRSIQWSPTPTAPTLSTDIARVELTEIGTTPTLRLHSTGRIQMGEVSGTEVRISHTDPITEDRLVRIASGGDVEIITRRYGSTLGVLSVDGDIEATGTVTSPSDARYKTDLQDLDGWSLLDAMQPRRFMWQELREGADLGFVAQELQTVVPEAVKAMRGGDLAVDYAKLSAIAIASVKKAKEKIQMLEQKVQTLEQKVADIYE